MQRITCSFLVVLLVGLVSAPSLAQQRFEPIDQEAVDLIRAEGLENSQVMDILSWITDVHGPRLTGSPALDRASDWAMETLSGMGLENVHRDEWGPFGTGWTLNHLHIAADSEFGAMALTAYPKAWSPGTEGRVEGDVVMVSAESMEDVEALRGTLAGKIVLLQTLREVDEPFVAPASRHSDTALLSMANAAPLNPSGGQANFRNFDRGNFMVQSALRNMVLSEMPLAVLDRGSKGDYGTIFVSSASVPVDPESNTRPRANHLDAPATPPQLTMAVEHYNRIVRMMEKGVDVRVSLDLDVTFNADDPMEHNVIAEIPGTDPEIGDEVVMLGAHFDSWHAATGTTDNGAGSAAMMEAVRILQNVFAEKGHGPRRTIRIALWTGEEQGLLGSRAYVNDHLAESGGRGEPPTAFHADYDKFSAYYNMDNGTGRIRGVYMQGNSGVEPIFRQWLTPFADLDASTLTISNTGGTDHLAFDAVGLPGFQFIQDRIAYSPRTHHSNMDMYDHAIEDDLKQAATIIASFVYHTAQRDEKLPRKPLPGVEVGQPTGR